MLNLGSLGQVVGVDQGIACLLQAGKQLEGLFEFETERCRLVQTPASA